MEKARLMAGCLRCLFSDFSERYCVLPMFMGWMQLPSLPAITQTRYVVLVLRWCKLYRMLIYCHEG